MGDAYQACCDDFASAVDATFANAIDSPTGWLLYGTDYDSVASGQPELRYWPIAFCPFCGASLAPPAAGMLRSPRRFAAE